MSPIFSSGKPRRLQARSYEEIEFEYLIGLFGNNKGFLGRSALGSTTTNPLNNHCAFATKATHKSGDLGLLHFNCILSSSRVKHILMLSFCTQSWSTPFFLEQTFQWCFWLLKHSKLQKVVYSLRRSLIGLVFSFRFEERQQVFTVFQLSTKPDVEKCFVEHILNVFCA